VQILFRIQVCDSHGLWLNKPRARVNDLFAFLLLLQFSKVINITSNNGYLGSRNDEDRSEFRYLMRIAELANHQTVERKLHFF